MKKRSNKNFIIAIIVLAVTFLIFWRVKNNNNYQDSKQEDKIDQIEQITPPQDSEDELKIGTETPATVILPEKIYINVPFIIQSPFASWDALHEDACEEASLLMIKYLKDNRNNISKTEADNDIKAMIDYEEANGYEISVTLKELNQIANDYFGFRDGEVKNISSVEDIKRELAMNKPVIVGASGKMLENPNFRNGGPNYHMLVIIGYDQKGFITNDPGTRKGEDFRYSYQNLYNSIHDWNQIDILKGEKNFLVF